MMKIRTWAVRLPSCWVRSSRRRSIQRRPSSDAIRPKHSRTRAPSKHWCGCLSASLSGDVYSIASRTPDAFLLAALWWDVMKSTVETHSLRSYHCACKCNVVISGRHVLGTTLCPSRLPCSIHVVPDGLRARCGGRFAGRNLTEGLTRRITPGQIVCDRQCLTR